MNYLLILLNKYGMVFHIISIVFWIYILYMNFGFLHNGKLPTANIMSGILAIFFIGLSIFNIYNWNKRRKVN